MAADRDTQEGAMHALNFYQGEHLAKIERTLRHAEATRRDDHDSWLNAYQGHVRWLVNELKLRLPDAD